MRERKKGVACRVLLDAEGSISRGEEVDKDLRDVECAMLLFRKATAIFARNHRKVAVIDGRIGITGGFGVDDKWLGNGEDEDHWRDTNVRVEGTAVSDMQEAFAEDWQEAGGGLLPPEDFPEQPKDGTVPAAFVRSISSPVVTRAERLTQLAIDAAHERLFIENAYFVPGKPVLELLKRRATEGCSVLGLKYRKDPATGTRFDTLRHELGDSFVAVEFEGKGHATVTEHRQQEAVDRIVPLPAARIRRLAQERLPRLGIPADHDAREDDGGGRSAGSHRLGQPRPALLEQARGGCARRGRSCARNAARAAVRGRRGSVEGAEVKAASSPRGELDVRPARK